MGIISTEQLQEALEKSKSYADEAAAGHLTIQVVEEKPDVEDAEENVLYAVPTEGSGLFETFYEDGYMSLPYYVDLYARKQVGSSDYMAALGTESSLIEYFFSALLELALEVEGTDDGESLRDRIDSLGSRISALEEQVSALTDSDAEEDSTEE